MRNWRDNAEILHGNRPSELLASLASFCEQKLNEGKAYNYVTVGFEVITAEDEALCEYRAFQDGARFGEATTPGQERFRDSAVKAFTNRTLAPPEFGNLAWGRGSCQGILGFVFRSKLVTFHSFTSETSVR